MKKLSVKGNKGRNKRSYVQIMDILLTQLEENLPSKVVASRYDITLQTVYKWKKIYAKHLENYKKWLEENDYYLTTPWLFPSTTRPNKHIDERRYYTIMHKVGDLLDIPYLGTHTMRKTGAYRVYV